MLPVGLRLRKRLTYVANAHRRMSFIAGTNAGADAHRLYYNNFAEAFAGIQYATPALRVSLERVLGSYLAGAPPGGGHIYWSVRPSITLQSRF